MKTTTIYTKALSARFVDDHRERVVLDGTEVARNRRGVKLALTLGELHELASDARHYSYEDYGRDLRSYGLGDVHRSAKKVVEQLKRDGLWELAWSKEAVDAYHVEWEEATTAEAEQDTDWLEELKAELRSGR